MSQKFYRIKLKTNFFDLDEIDFLLSQKNGCEYVVLYQMLCLQVANTNGKLQKELGQMIVPFDIEKIQRETKHFSFDTIAIALELYKKLGLIYEDENGTLTISHFTELVGSETKWAEYKRKERIKKLDIVQQEYKSIENRE